MTIVMCNYRPQGASNLGMSSGTQVQKYAEIPGMCGPNLREADDRSSSWRA